MRGEGRGERERGGDWRGERGEGGIVERARRSEMQEEWMVEFEWWVRGRDRWEERMEMRKEVRRGERKEVRRGERKEVKGGDGRGRDRVERGGCVGEDA